ncbi:hypothetical protein AADEFJLK_00408 [Methylovulum psychrotolerans]|uniref:Uncharacterized protein n=1 Tax=Methylovulum psychrotolerans TaxID=1704499 RepID=A0A2S5CRE9_9GAMM|nr:hypothetical protein AADEFJLK_00408 [Methylovulum psychrotolerans]
MIGTTHNRNAKVLPSFNAGTIAIFRQGYENRADGLTPPRLLLDNRYTVSALLVVGRRNPFGTGENSPQPIVAFLCPSFRLALRRLFIMVGLFGQPKGWPHLFAVFLHPLNPATHAVGSMGGGYPFLEQDSPHEPTRHPRPKSAYPRPSRPKPSTSHPREPSRRQTGLRDTQNLHGLFLAVLRSALHPEECRTQNQQA